MTPVEEFSESEEEYQCSYDPLPSTSMTNTCDDVDMAAKHQSGPFLNNPPSNPHIFTQNGLVYPQSESKNCMTDRVIKCPTIQSTQANVFASTDMLRNSLIWDQWLCCLATTLTPQQWQHYWINYLTLFGTSALPPHLADFFHLATRPRNSSDNTLQQTIHGRPVVSVEDDGDACLCNSL